MGAYRNFIIVSVVSLVAVIIGSTLLGLVEGAQTGLSLSGTGVLLYALFAMFSLRSPTTPTS